MVVAAYGLILPQWVLDRMAAAPGRAAHEVASVGASKHGCFNIHASLLPRWRGAAPIHRAIEAGDKETGVTIMQMDAGLDTGDMLMAHAVPIVANDATGSLQDRLAILGGRLMLMTLEKAAAHDLRPVKQTSDGVTYAPKIDKQEASIDWSLSALQISQRVRAFNPFPGATAALNGEILKIWMADVVSGVPLEGAEPGAILLVDAQGIAVAAKESIVLITQLQRSGSRRMSVADFVHGFTLQPGMIFR
jgi:methionyl-tRNA formyltransferase